MNIPSLIFDLEYYYQVHNCGFRFMSNNLFYVWGGILNESNICSGWDSTLCIGLILLFIYHGAILPIIFATSSDKADHRASLRELIRFKLTK